MSSLGIKGGTTEDVECSKVTKEFCREVPKKEDVMADVETCVSTPKQVNNSEILTFPFYCAYIMRASINTLYDMPSLILKIPIEI